MLDDLNTYAVQHQTLSALVVGAVVLMVAYFLALPREHVSPILANVPLVDISEVKKGQVELGGLQDALSMNCEKYRGQLWQLKTRHGTVVVLPERFISELCYLPEEFVSLEAKNTDRFFTRYTRLTPTSIGHDPAHLLHCVKHDLTRNIGSMMKEIFEETEYAFNSSLGECNDWKEIALGNVLTRAVALVSGRVFAGPELNRNPDYLQSIIDFTFVAFKAIEAISRYPAWQRPVAQYWVEEVRGIKRSLNQMEKILASIVPERLRLISEGKAPSNLTTWHINSVPAEKKKDLTVHAHTQLVVSTAAIHNTTMLTTHIIFDLLARPEYIGPIRDEISEVLSHENDNYLTKSSMTKLRKLDSFMKESQRIHPLGLLTFERKVMKDITLHDGTVLPKGCCFAVPAYFMAMDPERWGNPQEFDGNRFLKLRGDNSGGKYTFIETGIGQNDLIAFGHGPHACPGRFFLNNEIKVILSYLLLNYEMKLLDGESRPENLVSADGIGPAYSKKILIRRRR
ncbi:putative cytochrome P450 [Periconia macrospinosa]|uniref:Putative cytochrome P450 n=1 Tax=Periconia macrospinosa TaxID=97972 RepID=A0A2V1DE50_9PLEO|nr:putative cytochrome P450 [Periconia macrospinosa]